MKHLSLIINCLIALISILPMSARGIKWGVPYIFEDNGKYGLKINEEVYVLPIYEKLQLCGNNHFIYTEENGKQGILGYDRILLPAIHDEIINVSNIYGNTFVVYRDSEITGLVMLGHIRKYVDFSNRVYCDTIQETQILPPGQYKDFQSILAVNELICSEDILFCTDQDDKINIIDLKYGINMTPYYDLKKLKGNIKDVLKGKVPYSKLKIKRYGADIREEFDKIVNKHPELELKVKPLPQLMRVIYKYCQYKDSEILDSITIGPYKGVITIDGFISIPRVYSSLEDVLSRNPNNVMALAFKLDEDMRKYKPEMENTTWLDSNQRFEVYTEYYNNLCVYYETCIPVWESLRDFALTNPTTSEAMKDYLIERISTLQADYVEASNTARKFNRVANITQAMSSFASSLSSIASAMEYYQQNTMPSEGTLSNGSYSTYSTNPDEGYDFSLSEQTSYNRDKRTYECYDSQLASHFAGNMVMSSSSVKNAQNEMARLRKKWTDKGKSFPHSANETR
ncbi:MAG: hypothetical protein ACI31C_02045 [Muribaculaceae bacterium]